MVDFDTLHALLDNGDGRDRAFIDAMIRMGWARTSDPVERAELGRLHGAVRKAALHHHAALRASIGAGALRGTELRMLFDDAPLLERDHFVEEALGIAYPPLDEPRLEPELTPYSPSGYDEIVHALDATRLAAGDRFLDVGSGMGKAVMLAALLTGAVSSGIECDASLHALAESASRELGLDGARFRHGDARDAELDDADVVFMYLPFTGNALATVVARLTEQGRHPAPGARSRFLCAGALDSSRHPDLAPAGPSKSWLHVYTWR